MTTERLTVITDFIEGKKTEKIRQETQLETFMSTLKEKYGCSSIDEAKEKYKTMESELIKLETDLKEVDDAIEEKYRVLTEVKSV